MKKHIGRLICGLLAAVSLFSIQERMSAWTQGGTTIIIVPIPATSEGPRTPVNHPFVAELMENPNSVLLGVTSPCGTVSVRITSTAGDDYATYFDTTDGAILLPVSGNAGDYTLTITVPGGAVYVGEFSI